MIELNIPGMGIIRLEHLVSDVNGTLALDGQLIDGVATILLRLADRLQIHLLTADTHGQQESIDRTLGMQAVRIPQGGEKAAKAAYVRELGSDKVIAFGQGMNDAGMLKEAIIGICVLSPEGTAHQSIESSDLVLPDIQTALALLENPMRLVASLRR